MAGAAASCCCCRSSSSLVGLVAAAAAATMILMSCMSGETMYIVSATSFNVVNHCRNGLGVQLHEDKINGPSIGTGGFPLGPGESKSVSPPNDWMGNVGTGTPSLLAEFKINKPVGTDHYDLSAVDGFQLGVGLSITVDGQAVSCSPAPSICPSDNVIGSTCVNPNRDDANTNYARNVRASCPDAYSWSHDDRAEHSTGTGGTFTITFCP